MKELGLDGSSIGGLAKGAADEVTDAAGPEQDKSLVEILSDVAEQVTEAEEKLEGEAKPGANGSDA